MNKPSLEERIRTYRKKRAKLHDIGDVWKLEEDFICQERLQAKRKAIEEIARDIDCNGHITAEEFREHYLTELRNNLEEPKKELSFRICKRGGITEKVYKNNLEVKDINSTISVEGNIGGCPNPRAKLEVKGGYDNLEEK